MKTYVGISDRESALLLYYTPSQYLRQTCTRIGTSMWHGCWKMGVTFDIDTFSLANSGDMERLTANKYRYQKTPVLQHPISPHYYREISDMRTQKTHLLVLCPPYQCYVQYALPHYHSSKQNMSSRCILGIPNTRSASYTKLVHPWVHLSLKMNLGGWVGC